MASDYDDMNVIVISSGIKGNNTWNLAILLIDDTAILGPYCFVGGSEPQKQHLPN